MAKSAKNKSLDNLREKIKSIIKEAQKAEENIKKGGNNAN